MHAGSSSTVTEFRVPNCNTLPCVIVRRSNVTLEVDFTSSKFFISLKVWTLSCSIFMISVVRKRLNRLRCSTKSLNMTWIDRFGIIGHWHWIDWHLFGYHGPLAGYFATCLHHARRWRLSPGGRWSCHFSCHFGHWKRMAYGNFFSFQVVLQVLFIF